jgi:hypothetical protein
MRVAFGWKSPTVHRSRAKFLPKLCITWCETQSGSKSYCTKTEQPLIHGYCSKRPPGKSVFQVLARPPLARRVRRRWRHGGRCRAGQLPGEGAARQADRRPVRPQGQERTRLGLEVVETGRYRDYVENAGPDTRQFWYKVERCQHEIRRGPGQSMRWGVWETPAYDGLVACGCDDLPVSAALVAILDKQQWPGTARVGWSSGGTCWRGLMGGSGQGALPAEG